MELNWPEPYASIQIDVRTGITVVDKPSHKTVEVYTRNQIEEMLKGSTSVKCKGKNCSAAGSNMHSIECRAEHDAAVYSGAGNRNPEARYKGYTGEKLHKNASSDERAAWLEGDRARKL